ncbi:ferritin-like domain-containing protein [Nakamurella leprariae]|uniref:Ferritin-like domain-containing protein n=1 Tax=Nakamurella leprariae TaxID=2803911 RepID=A0A938YKF8_9ACTN|nr:ferritin-like domain-containing protein [Nakamurella leprariae]MBM9469415.1 ferritin-like domain-containing protein [Nakamurella leprariae]
MSNPFLLRQSRQDLVHGQLSSVAPATALGALNHRWALAAPGDFASDIDVLNYALTLEYLEAEFYRQGNSAGLLSGIEAQYLAQVGEDEQAHVTALTQTIQQLGGTPVEQPWVDFGDAFASRDSYLTTSVTFENVGVGAYLGAAGFIQDKTILAAAAGIFGVEARHAAVVAMLLGLPAEGGVYRGAFETPIEKAEVLAAVAPFLAPSQMAGGMPSGAPETGGGSTVSTDRSGLITAGSVAALAAAGVAAATVQRRRADRPAGVTESADVTGDGSSASV